jgi:hypothetical protein
MRSASSHQRTQSWKASSDRLALGEGRPLFLVALQPADHVATLRWLYPVDVVKEAAGWVSGSFEYPRGPVV